MLVCILPSCESGLTLHLLKHLLLVFHLAISPSSCVIKGCLLCDQSWDSLVSNFGIDSIKMGTLTGFQLCVPVLGKKNGVWQFVQEGGEWSTLGNSWRGPVASCGRITKSTDCRDNSGESRDSLVIHVSPRQISNLCAEEAAAQEQTGQVEECLKVNLLKIKTDTCKKVTTTIGYLFSCCFHSFLFFLPMLSSDISVITSKPSSPELYTVTS